MQFIAFLNDSYREAKNGWMLQIMLVLACLLIVLVASIGFRATTAKDQVSEPLRLMSQFLTSRPDYDQIGRPEFTIENVTASNSTQPWKSDYSFDFVVSCPTPDDMRKARELGSQRGLPTKRGTVQSLVRRSLDDYEKVEVEEPTSVQEENPHLAIAGSLLASDPPVVSAQTRYRVVAKGSKVDDPLAWPHHISILFFYEIPYLHISLRDCVYVVENWLVNKAGGWILLFVGVIITAGFIPNMLAKGSLDLQISKPIGRSRLFVYKYIGGLLFVFLLTTFTVTGLWVIIGLRSGIWTSNFLATIPILTFYFAILYAVSAATAMFTRNTLVAILMTGLAWGLLWIVGKVNDGVENRREAEAAAAKAGPGIRLAPSNSNDDDDDAPSDNPLARIDPNAPLWGFIPKSVFPAVTGIQMIAPRTYQIDYRLSRVIAEGVLSPYQLKKNGYGKPPRESWGEMIGVSLAFIAVVLGLACWRFETRDH